ncbi:DUF4405 domain-containing protein [Tamlana crocina]
MNRRFVGNILIITFLILLGSGLIMYFEPFSKNIAGLHTFFGLLFILVMVCHVLNNKKPLSNYISGKGQSKLKKFQSLLVFSFILVLAFGVFFEYPILRDLYSFGNKIRNEKLGKTETEFDYQIIELEKALGDLQFEIELKKRIEFQYPLFAVWIEDSKGHYVETLYISRVISSSQFDFGNKVNGVWQPDIVRRPEALPYWSHKRGIKAIDGLFMPLYNAQDLDAVSGATPTGNFIIKSQGNLKNLKNFKVCLEVNQSYDWNEFYSKDRFPNDSVYSGSGQVGQPSLIYETVIASNKQNSKTYKLMKIVGHGHHSGKNGKLFKDLSKITSAKEIVDRVIISIQ